jgi:hypothetical protein
MRETVAQALNAWLWKRDARDETPGGTRNGS